MDLSLGLMKGKNIEKNDIALARKRDKSAFQRLIDANSVSLYRVARGILKNEDDVEDAFQETIVKAYKGIVNLKKEEYFKTWIIRIMINECNSILRDKRKTVYLEESMMDSQTVTDNFERLELWNAINSLEKDLRIVTLLYYYDDLLQKDIAEILNIPDGTVRSRLSRAREKLREILRIEL